jgi:hypothetical protein
VYTQFILDGRYLQTGDPQDMFAFRTPPLHNVALTGPWLHNGVYASLEAMVKHDLDAAQSLENYTGDHLPPIVSMSLRHDPALIDKIMSTLDPLLENRRELDAEAFDQLLAFLRAQTSPTAVDLSQLVPQSVPSGLPASAKNVVGRHGRQPCSRGGLVAQAGGYLLPYLGPYSHEILPKYYFPLIRLAYILKNFRETRGGDRRTEMGYDHAFDPSFCGNHANLARGRQDRGREVFQHWITLQALWEVATLNEQIRIFCQPDNASTRNRITAYRNDFAFRLNSVAQAAPLEIRSMREIAVHDIVGGYFPLIAFRNEPWSDIPHINLGYRLWLFSPAPAPSTNIFIFLYAKTDILCINLSQQGIHNLLRPGRPVDF